MFLRGPIQVKPTEMMELLCVSAPVVTPQFHTTLINLHRRFHTSSARNPMDVLSLGLTDGEGGLEATGHILRPPGPRPPAERQFL